MKFVISVYKGRKGRLLGYTLIGVGVVAFSLFLLFAMHGLLSPNNENVQYVGSQNGYQGFVPRDTINYNGLTDPEGDLILDNGTVLHNIIWHGKYSNDIISNHNQIMQLNNNFVGKIDPVNHQHYVPLHDFYVIKGQAPVKQIAINDQTYYVIDANKISEADMSGFYTYQEWINKFIEAINIPGTYAAELPGNSPVFEWENLTGVVAGQTMEYGGYGAGPGGVVLILPDKTIIPYGITFSPLGPDIPFNLPQQLYNPSS